MSSNDPPFAIDAATTAAKAAPDGYTIHISAMTNQSISQAIFKNPPADLTKDFAEKNNIATENKALTTQLKKELMRQKLVRLK